MNLKIILGTLFFVILISLQYTLNKILKELKDIKRILVNTPIKRKER